MPIESTANVGSISRSSIESTANLGSISMSSIESTANVGSINRGCCGCNPSRVVADESGNLGCCV